MNKTITTIIPFFNSESTLPRMLDSILAGSVVPDEIILVDDGSTDNSKQVAQSYACKYPMIKYISKTHDGVSAARNFGLTMASCEWISFLDADDYIEPNMYEAMVNAIDDNCQGVICGYFTHKDDIVTDYCNYPTFHIDSNELINAMFTVDAIKGFLWNRLFNASLIKDRLFNESILACEDLLFQYELLSSTSLTFNYVSKPLYHYIQTAESATGESNLFRDGTYIYKPAFDLMLSMADAEYIPAIIESYNGTLEYSMYTLLKNYRNGIDVLSYIRIMQKLLKELPYPKKSLHRFAYCHCPLLYSFTLPHEF